MNNAFRWIRKRKPGSICIEAAHIYSDETPSEVHMKSAEIAMQMIGILEESGVSIVKQLFIDDYNVDRSNTVLNIKEYLILLREKGFSPDVVTMESSLEMPAKILFSKLENENELVYHGNRVYLPRKQACLLHNNQPVCNLLDAALYVSKMAMFDLAITVLPKCFKSQQVSTRKILKALGYTDLTICNIYC